mmetsp:Transcript_3140/g.12167  ORF Transcript_3140/g.12167 Transcript_3140/m.12167 type:complete len:347 (-) Transcript_3140:243-1283(-)
MAPKSRAAARQQGQQQPVTFDYSGLEIGMRCQAESDGVYYAAEVVQVSTARNRVRAPVKVHFPGYESTWDTWVGGEQLRSKALKRSAPASRAPAEAAAAAREPRPKIEMKPNTVVIVSTSAAYLKGHQTGLWLEELASPYYKFKEAGFEVVIASARGGPVPIDAASMKGDDFTAAAKKFMLDGDAFGDLSHSIRLNAIDFKSDTIKAVFVCGGHGACADFIKSPVLKKAIETVYGAGNAVAAVCHGLICLAQCKKPDGSPLVKDLIVTGFSESEEDAVKLADKVPFAIESKLKELGGLYEKGEDWSCTVKVAGNLITGQNPQSSEGCADAVIKAAKAIEAARIAGA